MENEFDCITKTFMTVFSREANSVVEKREVLRDMTPPAKAAFFLTWPSA
jgi:hypothetical protein